MLIYSGHLGRGSERDMECGKVFFAAGFYFHTGPRTCQRAVRSGIFIANGTDFSS